MVNGSWLIGRTGTTKLTRRSTKKNWNHEATRSSTKKNLESPKEPKNHEGRAGSKRIGTTKSWNHEVPPSFTKKDVESPKVPKNHEGRAGSKRIGTTKNWNHEATKFHEEKPDGVPRRKTWNLRSYRKTTKEELEAKELEPRKAGTTKFHQFHEERRGITEVTEEHEENLEAKELEPRRTGTTKKLEPRSSTSFTKKNLESPTLKQGASGDPRRKTWNHRSYRRTRRKTWNQKNWNHEDGDG
jgi:hypothetical protein